MSNELELVQDFMTADDASPDELAGARARLEAAIAAEASDIPSTRRAKGGHRAVRWSVTAVAAVAAGVVLVLPLVPTSPTSPPLAAAAQLSHLADLTQAGPALQPGQWTTYRTQGEAEARVSTTGAVSTPGVEAAIPLATQIWTNATGAVCTSQTFGTASFAKPAEAETWQALGLLDTPHSQPSTGCVGALGPPAPGEAHGAVDVSTLSHDPTRLAAQLQAGTTGIASLDEPVSTPSPAVAFECLTTLLVGPTTGQWPGFDQELLRTMSLIPGVTGLGRRTAHSGQSGLAFTMKSQAIVDPITGTVDAGPTVILDPETGALLEVSGINLSISFSAAMDFVGSPTAPMVQQGGSYGATMEWVDPVGVPSVVTADALPPWITSVHIVRAVTVPNASQMEIDAGLQPFRAGQSNEESVWNRAPTPLQDTYVLTLTGTPTDTDRLVAALTASGQFASVIVEL